MLHECCIKVARGILTRENDDGKIRKKAVRAATAEQCWRGITRQTMILARDAQDMWESGAREFELVRLRSMTARTTYEGAKRCRRRFA